MTAREVYQAFLELSPDERAEVFELIQGGLPEDEDDAFIAMVNERIAASDAAESCTPAEEVFARLLAK